MIVLYPVLVLSVIAGNGFVYADDPAAPAPASAPVAALAPAPAAPTVPTPVASAEAVNATTTAAPAKTDAPPSPTVAPTKAAPVPNTITSTNDNDDAPLADNYNSYFNNNLSPNTGDAIDRERLATTLDRITKVLDSSPSPGKGTAAVPLLPGKNYDFFLLKVPKHDVTEPKTEKPQPKEIGRNLEPMSNENSMSYPVAGPQPPPPALCPCAQPPPQISPDLSALQSIYGNALSFNALLDPVCPPGLVPVVVPNSLSMPGTMRMMPAIDNIPVNGIGNIDFNGLGQGFYNQYGQNALQNSQLPNPFSTPNGLLGSYPQNTPYNTQYSPLNYPQSGAIGPAQYPPPPLQPYQPYDQSAIVPYAQPPVNAPYGSPEYGNLNNPYQNYPQQYGNIPVQQQVYPSQYQPAPTDFPGSFAEYNRRNDLKSATKSLFR